MADSTVYDLATKMIEGFGSLLRQEVGPVSGVKKELNKLKDSISAINAIWLDAETKGAMNHTVEDWLMKLKEVAYDAEDVLDELATEALQQNVELPKYNIVVKQVRRCFSRSNPFVFRLEMARKIRNIIERLDNIRTNDQAGKTQFQYLTMGLNMEDAIGRPIDHRVLESILGRDGDKEKLVELLLTFSGGSSDFNVNNDVKVIPIIGAGGIGKTTLARHVYNDQRVQSHFDSEVWECISLDFKALTIKAKSGIQGKFYGQKYLLVLDDIRDEHGGEWETLRKLFISRTSTGSTILVTTQSQVVASIMQPDQNYHYTLGGLSEDHCESLFAKRAFGKTSEEIIMNHPELLKIGKDIVKKCEGVPLAAEALGGLLHHTRVEKDWLDVLNTEFWNLQDEHQILPALRISYNYLPSNLKQCFAHCSVFPQDHRLQVSDLIQQWMAHGFIKPPSLSSTSNSSSSSSSDARRTLEDIGDVYFRELLWRSFFQEVQEDDFGNITSCKMHDMVHSLARWVAGREWSSEVDYFPLGKLVVGRHTLLYQHETDHLITPFVENAQKLRSLRWKLYKYDSSSNDTHPLNPHQLDHKFITRFISPFRGLRLLDLSGLGMREVPKCIGYQLQQLRYLDLSNNSFEALPNSICRLYNLQMLRLEGCSSFKQWPSSSNIAKMVSLRHLVLSVFDITDWNVFYFGPKYMPRGLRQLACLQTLRYFCVEDSDRRRKGKEVGGLGELHGLDQLRGSLDICGLEKVGDARDAEEANLKDKSQLQSLSLHWCNSFAETTVLSEEVLGYLQPPPNLKVFKIKGYEGVGIPPRWTINSYSQFPYLVHLLLDQCCNLQSLPLIGEFPCLKYLDLIYLWALKSICHEVVVAIGTHNKQLGEGKSLLVLFPKLERLALHSMESLERWTISVMEGEAAQPNNHFQLLSLIRMFPLLTELTLSDCDGLTTLTTMPMFSVEGIQHLTSLRQLQLRGLKRLISLLPADCPAPGTLEELFIGCWSLVSLPGCFFVNLNLLSESTISGCNKLPSLPEEIGYLVKLKTFNYYGLSRTDNIT